MHVAWLICTGADVDRVKREIEEVIGIDCSNAILASAKQVSLPTVLVSVSIKYPST